jgi:hypothetical protein
VGLIQLLRLLGREAFIVVHLGRPVVAIAVSFKPLAIVLPDISMIAIHIPRPVDLLIVLLDARFVMWMTYLRRW